MPFTDPTASRTQLASRGAMSEPAKRPSRREQYAQVTRQAIVDAARKLFAERGYFATKVDDIAAEAQVAPATVYAVTGGKQGLLEEMVRLWSTDPAIAASMEQTDQAGDAHQVIDVLAAASRQMREEWADVIHILLSTAPHDSAIAEALESPTHIYRSSIARMAERLKQLGSLRPGIDTGQAADILWFYFGYGSYYTLHEENGWDYERAERWLVEQASHALLG
jgi:AcrR family transcriptional regulator